MTPMQIRFFTIPVFGGEAAEAQLNRFLAENRILAIDRQLVQDRANSAWALCLSCEPASAGRPPSGKRGKVDYREVLDERDFGVFARLRALRKEIADREGVPAYALFTNEQLAEMVQRRVSSAAAMGEIPGVGEARTDKYGEAFLSLLREAFAGTPVPDPPGHEA